MGNFVQVIELNVFTPFISRKYFKLECLEGGQWEESGCEPISCPALPDVFHGMYTCTNGLYYDTLCTLQCPDTTENVRLQHSHETINSVLDHLNRVCRFSPLFYTNCKKKTVANCKARFILCYGWHSS